MKETSFATKFCSECEKLLAIKVDCGLKFENYLDGVIKIASNKMNA